MFCSSDCGLWIVTVIVDCGMWFGSAAYLCVVDSGWSIVCRVRFCEMWIVYNAECLWLWIVDGGCLSVVSGRRYAV